MKFIHCGRQEFIEKNTDKNIILWGASKQLYEAIEDLSILGFDLEESVEAVIDKDRQKQGTICRLNKRELVIQGIDYLLSNSLENASILITSRFYLDIIKELKKLDLPEDTEIYAYPCIVLDNENTYEEKYASRITNQAMQEYGEYLSARYDLTVEKKEQMQQRMEKYLGGANGIKPKIIPSVVLMHSNICSLKCENCCDLIPKVKKPYYIDAEFVLRDLNNLLRGVDKCIRVDLTDGEAFLYKEIDCLLESLISNPKVETIFMFTNATIIPKETTLKLLQNSKCFLHISDYGLEEKMNSFIKTLKKHSINYTVLKNMTWMDFKLDFIQKRDENYEWLKYDFLRCGNKKCSKPLYHGKLYGCMPAFRYANIGIYENGTDYISILESDSDEEVWEKIKGLCMIEYINACQMCNFGNTGLQIISAGNKNRKPIYPV